MENIDDNDDDDDDDDNDDDDESGKHIKHSNYPQAITSFGIQKIFPSIEMHTILDQEFSSQIYGKKCFNPAAQQSRSDKYCQPDQFLAFSSSPASPSGAMMMTDLQSKQQILNQEFTTSSASSISSVQKSIMSLESLPTNLDQTKTKETIAFGKFSSVDRKMVQMWQYKTEIPVQLPMKGLSTTRSAICLQSSVATEPILRNQTVRHAISGNDIIDLENSDSGKCYLLFYSFLSFCLQ
ncbi:unnamed protein product [Wuchereria bancrofti]|uniref:Uncharacterized protein n=1 Tax=Wuchereria bancrofti TaxID=6293 RepID=A0A3P7EKS1_WUCBA|nr:unnamed protein product [Wuchereria bancrofti]